MRSHDINRWLELSPSVTSQPTLLVYTLFGFSNQCLLAQRAAAIYLFSLAIPASTDNIACKTIVRIEAVQNAISAFF
jgi:hypothetical protein